MLELTSENFELRSLQKRDAAMDWGAWTADQGTAAALNTVPRMLSEDERRAYISHMDDRLAYLLGIFEKATQRLVGIWTIYVDLAVKEYLLSVLVGPGDGRNQGALTETREPIYQHFFEELGMSAARINVLASNTYVLGRLKKQPWVLEHTSRSQASDGTGQVDVCHLRMTKDAWRTFHGRAPT